MEIMKEYQAKAFPNDGWSGWGTPEEGMDLRDYFACHAMQGMASSISTQFNINPKDISRDAYIIADAMMEARKQKVPFDNTPSVKEIDDVLNTLMLDDIDTTLRKVATLAWTRAFKKGQGK